MLQGGVPGARWVPTESLHLTLRFIGEVDEGRAADIDAALTRVVAPAFELVLDGVGQFGTRRRPTILWAGVAPDPALTFLHAKVDRALVGAGMPPDDRSFTPHVTLARLGQTAIERVGRWIAQHALYRSSPLPIRAFHLFESRLGSAHAVYEAIATYPLVDPSTGAAAQPHGLPHEEPLDRG